MTNTLHYKGFTGVVSFSPEDKVFCGKITMISDLVTFEGESVVELENAFQEAVNDYLETCKQLGKAPQKNFKGTFNIRINPSLHQQAYQVALAKNISLNKFVEHAIKNELTH